MRKIEVVLTDDMYSSIEREAHEMGVGVQQEVMILLYAEMEHIRRMETAEDMVKQLGGGVG